MNMVDRSGMLVRWVHRFCEGKEWVYEWKVMNKSRKGLKWDVRKWKSEIDKTMKGVGFSGRLRWNERRLWNGTEKKRPQYM